MEEPVSLGDIAPTLRVRLGLDAPRTDGVPLPVDGKQRPPTEPVRLLSMRENPFDRFDLWHADRAQLRNLLTLRANGTFEVDRSIFGRILGTSRVRVAGHSQGAALDGPVP